MLKIDNTLLVEIGLDSLPEAEKNSFLKHVYETLEMRVGIRLADQMTNEQLDEFEQYFEAKDDAGAFKWLETNFPNYKDIVQEEFDKLKSEVAQSAPQILAASQAAAANPQLAQQQPTDQPQPFQPSEQPQQFQQPQTEAPSQPQYPPQQPSAEPSRPYQPQAQPEPQAQSPPQEPPQQPAYRPTQSQYPPQQPPAGPQQ